MHKSCTETQSAPQPLMKVNRQSVGQSGNYVLGSQLWIIVMACSELDCQRRQSGQLCRAGQLHCGVSLTDQHGWEPVQSTSVHSHSGSHARCACCMLNAVWTPLCAARHVDSMACHGGWDRAVAKIICPVRDVLKASMCCSFFCDISGFTGPYHF